MDARQRLAELISASGISQAEVARRVGENSQWVNNRLRGESDIKADDIPRLAMALRVSPAAFFQQSSLAEIVLATFLRVMAEIPANYRQELWELVGRMDAPRSAAKSGLSGESQQPLGGSAGERATEYLGRLWKDLPEAEQQFVLEIVEVRHKQRPQSP